MNESFFVKPREGIKLRDPVSKLHLTQEGKSVPNILFWRRRIKAGDVVVVKEEKQKTDVKKTGGTNVSAE